MSQTRMSPIERRATFSVAGVFSTRMLGLFMIFPVFALFAEQEFSQVTGLQIGLAIGAYGLTQALLQLPYGMLSDRLGRKPLLIFGLIIFLFGSIVCAVAETIELMIIGRAIQGAGAISAVLTASISDLVSEQFRLRAMSVIGITIGFSFTLSLVLGPILSELIGVRGIFWIIALMAFSAIFIVIYLVPNIEKSEFQRETGTVPAQLFEVLKNAQLLRLDFGVLILHSILTAMFVVTPFLIRDATGLESNSHWEIYLPVMLLSFALMIPFIIQAESKGKMKQVFLLAILLISFAQWGLSNWHSSYAWFFLWLLVFFTAFNVLEASLPSLVVKLAPADKKGTASGVFASSQFLGAALGGGIGGYLYGIYGYNGVFLFTSLAGLAWFLIALSMEKPMPWSIAGIPVGEVDLDKIAELQSKMLGYEGVYEAVIVPEEKRAYFKVDRKLVNEAELVKYFQEVKAGS